MIVRLGFSMHGPGINFSRTGKERKKRTSFANWGHPFCSVHLETVEPIITGSNKISDICKLFQSPMQIF